LKADFQFDGGKSAHRRQVVDLEKFDGSNVLVAADADLWFNVTPDQCDLLDAANQAWTKLTPAQRAVDPESLSVDRSIWPEQIKLRSDGGWGDGTKVAAGIETDVVKITPQQVWLAPPHSTKYYWTDIAGTDVFERARQIALFDRGKRPPRVADALRTHLLNAAGQPYTDEHLGDKQFFVLYFGAGWCAPCGRLAPQFVNFMKDLQPKHPELQVIMLSEDKQVADMLKDMTQQNMPWPAIPPDTLPERIPITVYESGNIPQLVIVDRFGTVLADNCDDKGNIRDPMDTLHQLPKLLDSQPTTRP
jgi:thiol-disulfide isomerase/thioredoxin